MTIAILALQGAFAEHKAMLDRLGANCFEIRKLQDLSRPFDGLILPGGESTVMKKLLRDLYLFDPLFSKLQDGLPVFGTCAGLLLLAKRVTGGEPCFGTLSVTARRNAYGRQLESFYTNQDFGGLGSIPMPFIRAPYIEQADDFVTVLSQADNHIVAVREQYQLATAFHPELTGDPTVHRYFLDMIEERANQQMTHLSFHQDCKTWQAGSLSPKMGLCLTKTENN